MMGGPSAFGAGAEGPAEGGDGGGAGTGVGGDSGIQ